MRDNLVLVSYYEPPFSRRGVIEEDVVVQNAVKLIKEFDIRTPTADTLVQTLSSGDQQKVIVTVS